MRAPEYVITQESLTIIVSGKSHTIQKGALNYALLKKAILEERWNDVEQHLTPKKSLNAYAKGKFTYDGNAFSYDNTPLPADLNERIIAMATKNENPEPFFKFWERLQRNPSKRSVDQLWTFLQHQGIPLTEDGCFLAYKGIKHDMHDQHTGRLDNSPGKVLRMPRNKISDDPREACHEGLHVGALAYAQSFSDRVVICKIDPEDVVCVPYDESAKKMRVCKYEVIGNHNGHTLPSTTIKGEYSAKKVTEAKTQKKTNKRFGKLEQMDMSDLMKQSMDTLRKYATHGLYIVGASKLSGGKTALVKRIIEVRK